MPAAMLVKIVYVFPNLVGERIVGQVRRLNDPCATLLGPGEEVVVHAVSLGWSRGGVLRGHRALARADQNRSVDGRNRGDSLEDDELHGPAIFEHVGPVLAGPLRRERASGRLDDHFGVVSDSDEHAPRPKVEPMWCISLDIVQLRSLIQPCSDVTCETKLHLPRFARPDPIAGEKRAVPLGLVGPEIIGALVPYVSCDEAETCVGVGTVLRYVGLWSRGLCCRGDSEAQWDEKDRRDSSRGQTVGKEARRAAPLRNRLPSGPVFRFPSCRVDHDGRGLRKGQGDLPPKQGACRVLWVRGPRHGRWEPLSP